MIPSAEFETDRLLSTDGEIALINLESARWQSWSRFWREPLRPGIAETIVEQEQLTAQFLGDRAALERLDSLVGHLNIVDAESPRTALIHAQFLSMVHRFANAKTYLEKIADCGELSDPILRLSLSIDQACGANLDAVLASRRRRAATSRIEELVPLGALLADLDEFSEAARVYQEALEAYDDVSPFPLAWTCFQLGMLWGEQVPDPDLERAALWYRRAIAYLPCYVRARVHLAEICLREQRNFEAMTLLKPALDSDDPEAHWRMADALLAQNLVAEGRMHLESARLRYEDLLARHFLAFADHAAEFYTGSGDNAPRALELARANVTNRPTRRARAQLRELELTMEVAP
jgi:tetratricopeptide (TPR) repeat protein